MRKTFILLLAIFSLILITNADEMDIYFDFMTSSGLSLKEADSIYNYMLEEEQILVLSILAAKHDGDLDSIPPLKKQYESFVKNNPESINLLDKLFSADRHERFFSGAGWIEQDDRLYVDFNRERKIEYIEINWTDNGRSARAKLVADGYSLGSKDVKNSVKERFFIDRYVYEELFFIIQYDKVFVNDVYVKYVDDYYSDNYGNSYEHVKTVKADNSYEYIDINKAVSDIKFNIDSGDIFIEKLVLKTSNREYSVDISKTVYSGGEYNYDLPKSLYLEYVKVYWRTYSNIYVNIYIKEDYNYETPLDNYKPEHVDVSNIKLTGPFEAENTYNYAKKINSNTELGMFVIQTLTEKLRNDGLDNINNREALRALSRGNFIIRQRTTSRFTVLWW